MKRILILLALVSSLAIVTCGTAAGQGATAQISGTVKDQSGAVLPGAEITATQTETAAVRMTLSDEAGSYVLPNLPVGPYKLEVSLPGFRTFVQSGIVLQVNSSTVVNPVLNVGQVSETVEVQANAALVETRSTGIGQVVENARILELPLIGRQVTDLISINGAALSVQTTDTTYRGTYPNTTGFSIAGGLLGGNTYTLDGGMHNDVYANYGLPLPFPDALQEFKVETSSLPAQYGFHSGGAVNAVTRSGTNDFHGSLFEFVRNYGVNARNFFAPTRDGLKRNQYGGTIGGPIKKNKIFFFAGFQGTITRQTPQSTFSSVPTADMIAGDFTTFASRACQVRDFVLGAPFVNNRLTPSQISPAAVNIAKRLPAPVDQCGRTSWGNPVASDEYFPITKIDYQVSSTHSMFGRYMVGAFKQTPPGAISKSVLSSGVPGADDLLQSLTYGDTYLFGPNMINSFRATWNRTANRKVVEPWFGPSDVGMNIYQYLSGITSVNVTGGFLTGGLVATPANFRTTVITLSDDFSVVRSKHQMTFGASAMGFESNSSGNAFAPGPITITGGTTGFGLADFMAGRITNIQQAAPNKLLVRYRYLGLYAQDSWKLLPNLTFSYGLRWEPYFPQHYGENMMNHFDMDAFRQGIKSSVFVNAPAGVFYPGDPLFGPNGNAGMYKQWKHFGPRGGLVWDPSNDGKMVIRAGYGIFYDINTVELNLATGQGPPWAGKVVINNPGGGLDNPYRDFPGGTPFPFTLNKNVPYSADGVYDTFAAGTRVPYVQQWNLGVQRQIGKDWLVSVSYIGNELTHMTGARELDPAIYFPGNPVNGVCTAQGYTLQVAAGACSTVANTNARRLLRLVNPAEGPKIGILDTWDDGGTRSYNGMLLSMEKRFSRGYSFGANYTWSHCIGNPANTLLNAGAGGTGLYIAPTRDGDRGDCLRIPGITAVGEDRRHVVNMTGLVNSPKFSNHVLGMLAGNWRLSSIMRLQSGSAFDVFTGVDDMLSGINVTAQRADQISANPYGNKCTNDLIGPNPTCFWVDKNAFARPAPGAVGNMRPGMLRGPGYFNLDAGLSRIFTFKETQRVELRAEATNILNHTNFFAPGDSGVTNAQQTAFVTLTSNNFGRIQAARDARIFQFALKYLF